MSHFSTPAPPVAHFLFGLYTHRYLIWGKIGFLLLWYSLPSFIGIQTFQNHISLDDFSSFLGVSKKSNIEKLFPQRITFDLHDGFFVPKRYLFIFSCDCSSWFIRDFLDQVLYSNSSLLSSFRKKLVDKLFTLLDPYVLGQVISWQWI